MILSSEKDGNCVEVSHGSGCLGLISETIPKCKNKIYFCLQHFRDIGDNDLEEIPAKLFTINPKGHYMTALFLCGNKLKFLPRGLFDNVHYLQNL